MPLDIRPIATTVAVIGFFAVAVFCVVKKFSPMTCSKRAVIAALAAYIITVVIVKIINAILVNAMIKRYTKTQQETQ